MASAVVALFRLGLGNEVADFLVCIEPLGGDARWFCCAARSASSGPPSITLIDAAQALLDFLEAAAFQAAQQGERFLQVLEALRLRLVRSFICHQCIDLALDRILPTGERVELRLGDDERLVAVVGRDERLINGTRSAASLRVPIGNFRVRVEPALERVDRHPGPCSSPRT